MDAHPRLRRTFVCGRFPGPLSVAPTGVWSGEPPIQLEQPFDHGRVPTLNHPRLLTSPSNCVITHRHLRDVLGERFNLTVTRPAVPTVLPAERVN